MSTDDNTPAVPEDTNLDDFSAEFFGQSEAEPEPASSEDVDDVDTDDDATIEEGQDEDLELEGEEDEDDEEDTLDEEDDDSDEEDEDDEEADEANSEPKPKKKSRFQKRIDEIIGEREEEKRLRLALEARLAALEAKKDDSTQDTKTDPASAVSDEDAPDPNALNEDGTDKYPLGNFDPEFIQDLHKYAAQKERAALQAEVQKQQETDQQAAAIAQLEAGWNEKLAPAQVRYPDFQEKGQDLVPVFEKYDQAYGEYIGQTLMEMEHGPDVLYHLATNLDEAEAIMASGARKATIALGRIEAKFAAAAEEKSKARPKVSKAKAPPPRAKGTSVAKGEVPDDTDNLDAFEKEFFKSR